jgi:hypothetical protein
VLSEINREMSRVAFRNADEMHPRYLLARHPVFEILDRWVVDTPARVKAARLLGWDAERLCGLSQFIGDVRRRTKAQRTPTAYPLKPPLTP